MRKPLFYYQNSLMLLSTEIIIAAIAAISSLVTGILTFHVARKKASIDAASQNVINALKIVDEYQQMALAANNKANRLEKEFDNYRLVTDRKLAEQKKDIKYQEREIEQVNERLLKYQLILSIYLHQMRTQDIEPLISPEQWESITIQELRLIAEGLANIEKRRKAK